MNVVTTAVVQVNPNADKASNVDRAERLVRDAAAAGAQLVALPEYFSIYGHAVSPESLGSVYADAIEAVPGPTSERLGALAAELRIHLLGGSYFEREGDSVFNTSCLFDPSGALVARYRKTHLFVAPAQWGPQADGSAVQGRSMIVNPWGTPLAIAGDGEGFALAAIDLDQARTYRNDYPNLANRRPQLYTDDQEEL